MSPFLAEAPGGDTLLDVHPTQLQVYRVSFLSLKTGGKRSVISNHFFELVLEIIEMLTSRLFYLP